jgi:predicted short-subunit dehydrogenase-like oxidoreductase (DUF2520 family)
LIIGFIGAGKVGISLGKYFSIKGKKISGYFSKTSASSLDASKFTNSKAYSNIENLLKDSDFIFITTPDDKIQEIWETVRKYDIKNKIICHTSGSLSSKIFSDINNSNAFGYSLHPMFAFSDKYTTYESLNNAYFSIEGHEKHLETVKNFISSLGNKTILINCDNKALYHLANVTVSNLVLSLLETGCSYLSKCGVTPEDSINALMPLIKNNINNINEKKFMNSLTGPIERNDIGTVKHHFSVIPDYDVELYKLLSLKLLSLAQSKHTDRDYSELKNCLNIQKEE